MNERNFNMSKNYNTYRIRRRKKIVILKISNEKQFAFIIK